MCKKYSKVGCNAYYCKCGTLLCEIDEKEKHQGSRKIVLKIVLTMTYHIYLSK